PHQLSFEVIMKVSIRTRSIETTGSLRELISKRLHFALDAFGDRVRNATVHLADINGPRGGVDKTCQITATVQGIGDVQVRDQGASSEAAVTRAARRLKHLVGNAVRQAQRPATESIRRMAAFDQR